MAQEENIYIYGKNAVAEALAGRKEAVKRISLYQDIDDKDFLKLIKESGVPTDKRINERLPAGISEEVHQGVVAVISASKLIVSYDDFINNISMNDDTALVLLDELTDPQNVGAVIRSAAAFGFAGVLIPPHNQAPITGAVVKVSAGMAFRIPLISIGNVNNTIRDLKEKGFWTYGLAGEGANSVSEEKFDSPTLIVVGSEGKGIRQKTRETCDILIKIPIEKRCESLNASAAASVAFYAWSSKHPRAIKK